MNLEFFHLLFAYLIGVICASYLIYFYKKKVKTIQDRLNVLQEDFDKITKNPSYDCQMLMREIMSGSTLVKIEVIDSGDLFMWKPGKR